MKKLNFIIKCGLALLLLSFYSCESWLNVTPSDRLSEEMLFNDREGFVKALNGVYIELNTNELYGRNLTAGALDVMGQYYSVASSSHVFYNYGGLVYTGNDEKALFDNMWQKCYAVIACCNTIIEKCDENKAGLSPVWRGAIKGEALALRAMLHFDMLRLFGPLTSELDKESIPYQTNSDQTVTPLLSGSEVVGLILDDLKNALSGEELTNSDQTVTPLLSGSEVVGLILDDLKNAVGLLKDTDPYFVEEEFSDTDLNYRRFRMNYFAAKGLMARVQLWGGDKEKAAATAKEVIAEGQAEGAEFFPFVTNSEATSSNPDRVFYSEVLFGTYHSSREKLHEDLFAPTLESTSILTLAGTARRDDLYDNENDYRYSVWSTYNKNGTSVLYHRKFEKQDNVTASRQYMIPLIRMSEMYLIAVECCKLDEASVYLNTFRNARNCNSLALTEDNRINILANEYKKEMLGEGQLFFFYKRQEMVNIPDGNQATGTKNVELAKYVVPLPESETDQRISSTDISNE